VAAVGATVAAVDAMAAGVVAAATTVAAVGIRLFLQSVLVRGYGSAPHLESGETRCLTMN
jgi:hypothetical protein